MKKMKMKKLTLKLLDRRKFQKAPQTQEETHDKLYQIYNFLYMYLLLK